MSYYATINGPHLEHKQYKYIRKYKSKSGKWVYVYANSKQHSNIKSLQSKSAKSSAKANKYLNDTVDYADAGSRNIGAEREAYRNLADNSYTLYESARDKAQMYDTFYDDSLSKLSVSKQFQESVNNGKKEVSRILNNMNSAVDNTNKRINDINTSVNNKINTSINNTKTKAKTGATNAVNNGAKSLNNKINNGAKSLNNKINNAADKITKRINR